MHTPWKVDFQHSRHHRESVEFRWYEPIYYYEDLPNPKVHLTRWLGIANRAGQALCCWLIIKSGKIIARTTIRKITKMNWELTWFRKTHKFDDKIQSLPSHYLSYWRCCLHYFSCHGWCLYSLYNEAIMPEDDDMQDTEVYDQYIMVKQRHCTHRL